MCSSRTNEQGFTLIELLAVGVVMILLLVVSLFLLRPQDYSLIEQNAKRRTAVASMVQAINRYAADTGHLPPNIPSKMTAISSESGHYDLCKYVVPKYLQDIPLDPQVGIKERDKNYATQEKCNTPGLNYAAGYAIYTNKAGQVIVSSPIADEGAIEIAVPKRP